MKIKIAPNTTFKRFGDIKPGKCFESEGTIFIKVDEWKGCDLKIGGFSLFYSEDEVIYLPKAMLVNMK